MQTEDVSTCGFIVDLEGHNRTVRMYDLDSTMDILGRVGEAETATIG